MQWPPVGVKWYYSDPSVCIAHGDCREILPLLPKVDLVLTDPPYGIGEAAGKNKSRCNLAVARDYGDSRWDDAPIDWAVMSGLIDLGLYACVFGGNYYPVPPVASWLVWDKLNGASDFADCELAWTNYGCAVRRIVHRWNGMLREGNEKREHPTQKPIEVIKWAISLAPKADTILDPFMGSGTTLRAAKDLGRKAIGIEIKEKYAEIAARRCAQEVLDLKFE